MSHSVNGFDRLRIERLVWTLDQLLYDLPRASRISKRREVRDNLIAAAADVGTGPALRRLGGTRRLSEEYLTAELGDGPRYSWMSAGYFAALVPLVLNAVLSIVANAFESGATAVQPHLSGVLTFEGASWLQSALTFTFIDGQSTHTGGAWTPLTYLIWAAGTVVAGRLWRLLPRLGSGHAAGALG